MKQDGTEVGEGGFEARHKGREIRPACKTALTSSFSQMSLHLVGVACAPLESHVTLSVCDEKAKRKIPNV